MPAKTKTKEQREGAMMSELCQKHGYTFIANRPGDRVTLMFGRGAKRGAKRLVPMYTMRLAVPMNSALGKQMLEQYPLKKKT